MMKKVNATEDCLQHSFHEGDRRLGIDRRCFSPYSHIPERRSGTDRRSSGDIRKGAKKGSNGYIAA